MKIIYQCPHCSAALNAKQNIILAAKKSTEPKNKGLVLLHEELGNYTVASSASLTIETGDEVDFYCPVCKANLQARKNPDLAEFTRIDRTGSYETIFISRTYGERCTFQLSDKKKMKTYGESVKKFQNPEWFL